MGIPHWDLLRSWLLVITDVSCHPPQKQSSERAGFILFLVFFLLPLLLVFLQVWCLGKNKALLSALWVLCGTACAPFSRLHSYYYSWYRRTDPICRRTEVLTFAPTTWRIQAREGKQPRKWGKGGRFQVPPLLQINNIAQKTIKSDENQQ